MLTDYHTFSGRHPETGTVHNALAYQGVTAPHTGAPPTEALLMGVSGGAAFGYFTFEYEGYPPHLVLITRNTFDPLETLFERLVIPREVLQTTSADKAEQNLRDVLDGGRPALAWVDSHSLPHNNIPDDEHNWGVSPVLVYGWAGGQVFLADRAGAPVVVPASDFVAAHGRIKKNKFRVMALDAPDFAQLPAAVSKGIWGSISLFTDAPPAGKRDSWGLQGLAYWAKMLTNTRNKKSWTRYFPAGERLWMALAGNATQPGAFGWLDQGERNAAERGLFADFVAEAATILQKPALNDAADLFRKSEGEWALLKTLLLPAEVPLLKEAADLLSQRRRVFLAQEDNALAETQRIQARLDAIQGEVSVDFPLDDVPAFYERLAAQVAVIESAEREAVQALQDAMA